MASARLKTLYFHVPGVVRKCIILVVGMTILLIGIAMIVLPGPAILVIPLGLLILAVEFVWAKSLLEKVKERKERVLKKYRRR